LYAKNGQTVKYSRIVLDGYKRMRLNGIDHFEMLMTAMLQLILGTNGSGKSSLLWELSPLPANPADFSAGGKKIVEFECNGSRYVLTSSFGTKQEHSFICDDKELNQSKLVTVQKELVKEYFKITTDVQELISGQELFSAMSTARRKDWFLRLCDVDYDYALHVFGLLKNAHRDRLGAIRLERKALVVESEKLLSDQEIAQIGEETKSLHECLSHLLEYRKPVETVLTTLQLQSHQLDKQLMGLSNNFADIHQKIKDREHSDSELMELIEEVSGNVVAAQTKIAMLAEQHEKTSQKIAVLQKAGENTIASLEQQLVEVQTLLSIEAASTLLNIVIDQPESAFMTFSSIKSSLLEIFTNIPTNSARQFSQGELAKARDELNDTSKIKDNILEKISDRKASLSHMRDHMGKPDATCPKCGHGFSLIYSEERVLGLTQNVKELEEEMQSVTIPRITQLEAYIEECGRYGSLYRQFMHLTSNSSALNPYWDYLADKKILSDNPMNGAAELERIEQDLRKQIELGQLKEKLAQLRTNLEMLKSVGDADLNELQKQAQTLENDLSDQTQILQVSQAQQEHYKSQFALRAQAKSIRRSIRKIIRSHRDLMVETTEYHRRSILNQLIRDLQSALATREHALFAAQRQKETVDSLAKKIANLEQEEKALAILVKELSPTEGLIAEGILGFIKNFCDQMNNLIAQVWTYPLVIKSCEVVEDERLDLDYKFPLIVGEDENKVSDVAKGSEGMCEIINLAFRMVAAHYLGLENYPLYLDELGRTFDKDHRTAAANMVRALIEQNAFPQVFMISHYQGLYGALTNAQVCVLNETNIMVPKDYNQHVVMH
jgi:DNA repair exonuclease SbcCD ATPase subunit